MNVSEARAVKAAVRARDGMRCTRCGMTNQAHIARYGRSLDVHRVIPGSDYSLEGCVTLCKTCHGPQPRLPHGERQRRAGFTRIPASKPLVRKARMIASYEGTDLFTLVDSILRPAIEAKFLAMARNMTEDSP